jgi:hypothetical protein
VPFSPHDPPYDRLMAAAETVADERAEVDRDLAREVFGEAATLLHNGLALDGLDDHDTAAVIDGLAIDLVSVDPGEAIRARSQAVLGGPGDLHDAEAVSTSLLVAAALLRL